MGISPATLSAGVKRVKKPVAPNLLRSVMTTLSASGGSPCRLINLMKMGYGGWGMRVCCCKWTAILFSPTRCFPTRLSRTVPGAPAQNASRSLWNNSRSLMSGYLSQS
ncbi:hypothetical protein KIF59_05265 [Enterobacter cloacae subsp. cloacae]|nr:hypothetical protein [Enterobacter cloacae subsp. cloacae]